MMNQTAMQATYNDAELVAASLAGDRQAFGQIVERYQNLICSVAYSATGSLAQSQDLAQETFVAAWTQLRNLREPMKLRAWLCGIARNLVNNSARRSRRDATNAAEPLENVPNAASPEPVPVEAVISREEEAILWRSLEQIPELYREPLVLFYREHQSIERVAEALELSEDATKQRLSRGRKLLQEQVTAFVEGALRRSAPGKAFTLGVLVALPALAASATAATIGATAAKGTAAAKTAAGLGLFGAVLGPILGILGGYLGAKASIENTESPRERQFMVKLSWIAAGLAIAFTVALSLLTFNAKGLISSHPALFVGSLIILITGYVAVLFALIARSNRRQQQIRREEASKRGVSEFASAGKISKGFEYRSNMTLLGLPLIHVKLGNALGQGRGPAKGWIAIGDTAVGILFAAGGVAVGGVALGGLSLGVVSIAGAAFGALALGGWAMGLLACGGGAVGWFAAFGGLAVAHDYALGGLAIAQHANDSVAREFLGDNGFFRAGKAFMEHSRWLVLLAILPVVLGWRQMKKTRNRNRRMTGP
jgi:RNA polymerase sigma factor (sigma-70 family)